MAKSIFHDGFAGDDPSGAERVIEQLRPLARPLSSDRDLDPLLERIGDARYVLLGEATHGTADFYSWRARITQRLIREKGFSFVAVEGDWPDCFRIDRYVKRRSRAGKSAKAVLQTFDRWPTWMWANREVELFVEWLREHNRGLPEDQLVGFYGLDVYSLWDSMRYVLEYLDKVDPAAAQSARRAYECFAGFDEDEQRYARATAMVPLTCEREVASVLSKLRQLPSEDAENDGEARFDAEQNAIIARNAELYYRTMIRGGSASWNVRDDHMVETLERLMAFHGPRAKAVVWEHNTHIGDARYTDMVDDGEHNVGQLVRERYGHDGVVLVGFSTHRGTVMAGDEWGAPMRRMIVPPGRPGSYEDVFQRLGAGDGLFLFDQGSLTPALCERRGHRAIGVVYRPSHERFGNYVPTVLPKRYDALLFVEQSRAVSPLHTNTEPVADKIPETYPTGV